MKPAGVAHRGRVHAGRLPEDALGAPEAAHAEHGALGVLRERRLERSAEHEVALAARRSACRGPGSASSAVGMAVLRAGGSSSVIEISARSVTVHPWPRSPSSTLPEFDFLDTTLSGERFHATMTDLARALLARQGRARLLRARSRGRGVLPAHEERDLPRDEDRRAVRGGGRPALRGDAPQHPPRQRRRPPPPAQPGEPGLHAARGRPLAPGHARTSSSSSGRAWRAPAAASSWPTSPSPTPRSRSPP